jgi:hypothetical protein
MNFQVNCLEDEGICDKKPVFYNWEGINNIVAGFI